VSSIASKKETREVIGSDSSFSCRLSGVLLTCSQKFLPGQSGVGTLINPTGRIKKLEANLRFSDTFNNRIALADACLEKGFTDRAIELYESSLAGNFTENEYVLSKLIIAYFQKNDMRRLFRLEKNSLRYRNS